MNEGTVELEKIKNNERHGYKVGYLFIFIFILEYISIQMYM